jgi:hypothetical protein
MSRLLPGRSLWSATAPLLLAACGSRTPLLLEPSEDTPPDAAVFIPIQDAAVPVQDAAEPIGCITGTRAIHEVHIDLYFTLDKSKSMMRVDPGTTMSRWGAVSSALDTFINAPLSAGLGAGIGFFPRTGPNGDLCSTADYAFPVVPIGTLPGVAPSILKAISVQTLLSGTPMTPALDGAHVYARSRVVSQPDHTPAVVMVTDGIPHDCGSSVPGTAAVAASAVSGSPPIRTYVLGVGPSLESLNMIAAAGGTTQAYLVVKGGEAALLAQLEAIRTSALACEYVFPAGTRTRFDVATVTTQTGVDAGPITVDRVASAEACGGGLGWFYDNPVSPDDPPPTKITLCPSSCTPLVKGTGSHLDVRVGCLDVDP